METIPMHPPVCENHDGISNTREAAGMTGDGRFLCRACVAAEYNYAVAHVPEAMGSLSLSAYAEECRQQMLAAMQAADAEAARALNATAQSTD